MKRKGNNIGWCDKTANPVTGCPNGCEYCYARGMNERFKWVEDFSKPQFFPNRLKEFRTKEPMIIFIDSMSDIGCWDEISLGKTVDAINENQHNIYLALTKCYAEIRRLSNYQEANSRFYIGATVTNNAQAQAVIDAGGADLISFEPLMEEIRPELLAQLRFMWWIVGDLTKGGVPQKVTEYAWVEEMRYRADHYKIPLFMKDSLLQEGFSFVQQFPRGWRV